MKKRHSFAFLMIGVLLFGVYVNLMAQENEKDSSEKEIVPGERVGRFVLCMDRKEVYESDSPIQARKRLSEKKIYLTFSRENKLAGIWIANKEYKTNNGLHVGSSVQEVLNILGEPEEEDLEINDTSKIFKFNSLNYFRKGIIFVLGKNKNEEHVRSIYVLPERKKEENKQEENTDQQKDDKPEYCKD